MKRCRKRPSWTTPPPTESPRPRLANFTQAPQSLRTNRLAFSSWGKKLASPETWASRSRFCMVHASEPGDWCPLSTLSFYDRQAGRRAQRNAWQPRTELPEGALQGPASHHLDSVQDRRTSIASSASSSSRFAIPGEGRGVSRLMPIANGLWHQLEDGVHYAEAPSSLVHRRISTRERYPRPRASARDGLEICASVAAQTSSSSK